MTKCRVCGCTDEKACPGGCSWVEPDLCSRCEKIVLPIMDYSAMTLIVGRKNGDTWPYKLRANEISAQSVQRLEDRKKEGGWDPLAFGIFQDAGKGLLKLKDIGW